MVRFSLFILQPGTIDGLNDVLHVVGGDLFVGDVLRVLGGDDNGVDALGDWYSIDQLVLTRDLRLSTGANPVAGAVLAHLRSLEPKLVASMWVRGMMVSVSLVA